MTLELVESPVRQTSAEDILVTPDEIRAEASLGQRAWTNILAKLA
jgi:hypothetical protein